MLAEWIKDRTDQMGFQTRVRQRAGSRPGWLLACLAVVGVILLLGPFSAPRQVEDTEKTPAVTTDSDVYGRDTLEHELAGILSRIEGAGRVEVRLSLASTGARTYAFNNKEERRQTEEGDKTSGVRQTTETSSSTDIAVSGNQSPILIDKKSPVVTGVLVIAEGAVDPDIKEQLTDAVITLLDISAHRVRVLPRQAY